jgi:hypothetical protein
MQRRGTPADFARHEQLAFGEPAFVDQFAHEQADSGLGQAQHVGQRRARQPGLGAHLAHDGHAVQLFEELLVTGNWHGVRKSSGCDDYATGWKNLLIMQTAYLRNLSRRATGSLTALSSSSYWTK